MPQGIVIIAWRNDVGAYLLDSFPENIEVDGQDLMQIYNMHRFRATDPNFQFVKIGADLNLASFYSGGYKSNFIGKPNYCVTLLLDRNENAIQYERVLIKATNNLLRHLNDDDFEIYMSDVYAKIKAGDFDAIKIERSEGEVIPELDEAQDAGSQEISEERAIFENLVAAAEEIESGDEADQAAFDQTGTADPFGSTANPFGDSPAAKDPFATDPFTAKPAPAVPSADPFAADPFAAQPAPATPKADPFATDPFAAKSTPAAKPAVPMMKPAGPSTPQLIKDLKILDMKKPSAPADQKAMAEKDRVEYLENLVSWFEQKLSMLSKIAKKLQEKEAEVTEKDELIGKLLLLLS